MTWVLPMQLKGVVDTAVGHVDDLGHNIVAVGRIDKIGHPELAG